MTETELVDAYACVGPLMATAYERSGHEVAGAYRSWTRQVNAEIETLVEEAAQEGYDFLESAGAQNQSMVRLNIVALVLGVAGGVLVGWLMSWRIVNPIVRITNTLHELSEGRSDVEPPRLERKDEIGALGRAIVRLQRHLTGTVEIARSIAEGDLSVAP